MYSNSTTANLTLPDKPAWRALQQHYGDMCDQTLRQLFDADPERGQRFVAEAAGLRLDYSKNHITQETVRLLVDLALESGLGDRITAMFSGQKINVSEQRAALHVALRALNDEYYEVDGVDVVPDVHAELDKMSLFSQQIRSGQRWGYSGRPIRNIVNIGIGGSHLGPLLACEALYGWRARGLRFRFVSSPDGSDFSETTRGLAAEETLFIVCSKTFTTPETLLNIERARRWCLKKLGSLQAVGRHFVAVTANPAAAADHGIVDHFDLWDWVGGRYSLPSAVGLTVMVAVGPQNFRAMLAGYHAMDTHFRSAPFEQNLPVLMGLLAVWYNNFFGAQTIAVLPYLHGLRHLPAYLQQLWMESNGKSITLDDQPAFCDTSPVCWGQQGTEGQHSFYQLLHHGTRLIPCDFIGFCHAPRYNGDSDHLLIANLLAQTAVLAFGDEAQGSPPEERPPHRRFNGNHPSNTLLAEQLTPEIFGALIALYEHSVFTQSAIWNINAFDQWGVELGKVLARRVVTDLENDTDELAGYDSSTSALIDYYRRSLSDT